MWQNFLFAGSERVSVEVTEATTEIKLHARELYLSEASFKPAEGTEQAQHGCLVLSTPVGRNLLLTTDH